MKIIISPAKKMRTDRDFLAPQSLPRFLDEAERLKTYLAGLSLPALRRLLAANDAICAQNYERYQTMELRRGLTPALLAYDGIQYQYMAPQVFEAAHYTYVGDHLRILSGLYGILRPFDGVTPYRLEMQAKLKTDFCSSLYDYWGDRLYRALAEETDAILDLASDEYGKAVYRYRTPGMRYVTCVFGELAGGRLVQKGVYVKMARGEMVRFLAECAAEEIEAAKRFDRLGYAFCPERSDETHYVFLKNGK